MEFDELGDWEDGAGNDRRSSSPDDHHMDFWATLRSETLSVLRQDMLDAVLLQVAAPGRPPRADIKRNAKVMVATIVANLIVLHQLMPHGACLVVPLANTKATRYDRKGFPKLSQALDALQSIGLIDKFPGEFRRYRTTVQARGRLLEAVTSSPGLLEEVIRAEGEEVIVLNARPPIKRLYGKRVSKVIVDYTDTDETRRLRAEMQGLNRHLAAGRVTLGGNAMPQIGMHRKFSLRSADDPEAFNLHGRLYGAFWLTLRKVNRDDLRIDGEDIADLDFTAMFPSLAYIRAGHAPPEGDPYEIKGLEGHRSGAKAAMSAFLSADGRLRVLPEGLREELPDGWSIERLRDAILEHHPLLAASFEQDLSLEFMFTESRIMMRALGTLIAQGITALPIHDGMMVAKPNAAVALSAMEQASIEVCGVRIRALQK